MKVNMTPNPLDVVTIHASQGDSEARQWEFELHNNGELIDTSGVTDQMVFKAYKGGTEQILPENTSTPTTSPFKGDIKYPQGLLSDQEFLYRESPTEEDGLAWINSIKGNTLVWNQQMDSSRYNTGTYSGVAVTKSTDETYLIANGTATANAYVRLFNVTSFPMISGHKYLCVVPNDPDVAYYDDTSPRQYNNQYSSFVFTSNGSPIRPYARINNGVASTNRRISFMMIDLTQMGLDITDPSDFTSLFSLPYYAYNQGTLLSFMGNGIKTVGKNLCDISKFTHTGITTDTGQIQTQPSRLFSEQIRVIPNQTYIYTIVGSANGENIYANRLILFDANGEFIRREIVGSLQSRTFTIPNNCYYIILDLRTASLLNIEISNITSIQFELGSTATSYEPYTSSTLSLPISTYFPNGMDGVGTDYDELTNTKATTRMTRVDLGTIAWGYNTTWSSIPRFYSPVNAIHTKIPGGNIIPNFRCVKYKAETSNNVGSSAEYDKCISVNPDGRVYIQDSSFTDPVAFKESLSGVYLVYPLATPTETSFTTASLVTENAEIPLSNEDGILAGKCTEQLSAEPGFHDAKIKLSDGDGTCYSNKLQLHIERSPQ